MSTLFAFLHHRAAFTLVSALAVEFILIGQELSLAAARRPGLDIAWLLDIIPREDIPICVRLG